MAGSKDPGQMGSILEQQKCIGPTYSVDFERNLRYGFCVGIRMQSIPGAVDWPVPDTGLTDVERLRAAGFKGPRRPSFIAGRLALRAALLQLGIRAETIDSTDRGAPILPDGAVGSISHKRHLAVGMAALDDGWTLGVDIEAHKALTQDISQRVLTQAENDGLDRAGLTGYKRTLAVLLRFSLKEAVYKAIDPFVTRYVGFREVSVDPGPDGQVAIRAHLDPEPDRPLEIRAHWTTHDSFFLSSARAREA